jgi:hypothetical protein
LARSNRSSGPFSCTNTSIIIYDSSASEGSNWPQSSIERSSESRPIASFHEASAQAACYLTSLRALGYCRQRVRSCRAAYCQTR